jgi:hypothetical protein
MITCKITNSQVLQGRTLYTLEIYSKYGVFKRYFYRRMDCDYYESISVSGGYKIVKDIVLALATNAFPMINPLYIIVEL